MIDSINPQLPYIPPKPKNDNSKKFVVSEVPYDDDIYNYRAFTAYSTETNKSCGIMLCRPSIIIKGDNVVRSMQIGELYATSNQKGAGTALLDYARALSKTEHCVGIHLVASGCYSPEKVPHLFYRKYGMNTGDKKLDKKMDKFIKRGKKATHMDFDNVVMYFPPVEYPKKNTIWRKLFRCLNNIFATSKKCVAR